MNAGPCDSPIVVAEMFAGAGGHSKCWVDAPIRNVANLSCGSARANCSWSRPTTRSNLHNSPALLLDAHDPRNGMSSTIGYAKIALPSGP